MQIILLVAFLIVVTAGIFSRTIPKEPTPASTPSPTLTPTFYPSPTVKVLIPTSTIAPKTSSSSIDFQYPGSIIITSGVYQSFDSPDKITDWYKNKMKSMGYSANSFVKTSTNGNILNKLVSANGSSTINVEISRSPSDSVTKIIVHS